MGDDLKNKTFDKDIFKTPQSKTRSYLCLKKTKSSLNCCFRMETEPSTTPKKNYKTKTNFAFVSKFLLHQNSMKQLRTFNNNKFNNKTFDVGNYKKINSKTKNNTTQINNKKEKTDNKKKLNKNDKDNNIKIIKTKKNLSENKKINEKVK